MIYNILESILNEISAEDAYNKFYNKIPRSIFDKLVSSYGGKFDNFIKFILNDILKSSSIFQFDNNQNVLNAFFEKRIENAIEIIQKYKSLPNEVRMKLLNNFKSGSYKTLDDLENGMEELLSSGVETLKSIQGSGLINVYEDDDYKITCTTTYEANHHYYGTSKWCTASDRLGRYDGWKYFLVYIFDASYSEIDDVYELILSEYDTVNSCLVQITKKASNEIYQVQFTDGYVNQVCDFEDNSVSFDEDIALPKNILDSVFSNVNLNNLVSMTSNSLLKEYPYQRNKDKYIKAKRDRLEREREEMSEMLSNQIAEMTNKKAISIIEKVKSIFSTNLFESEQFIEEVVHLHIPDDYDTRTNSENILKFEDMLKKHAYMFNIGIDTMSNDKLLVITLMPVFGIVKTIEYGNDGNPYLIDYFTPSTYYEDVNLGPAKIIVIAESDFAHCDYNGIDYTGIDYRTIKIKKILKVIKNEYDIVEKMIWATPITNAYSSLCYASDKESRINDFLVIEEKKSNNYLDGGMLLNPKTQQEIKMPFRPIYAILYDNCFLGYSDVDQKGFVINLKSGRVSNFSLKIVCGSYSINGYGGYWYFGINNKTGKTYLFCDKIIDLSKYNLNFNSVKAYGYEGPFIDFVVDGNPILKYDGTRDVIESTGD